MAVHDIYIRLVNVPAKYPGKMTAKFKPISSNSSFHFKSVSPSTVQDNSGLSYVQQPYTRQPVLCLTIGIYHKDSPFWQFVHELAKSNQLGSRFRLSGLNCVFRWFVLFDVICKFCGIPPVGLGNPLCIGQMVTTPCD